MLYRREPYAGLIMKPALYAIVLALVILAPSSLPIEVLGAPAPTYTPGVKAGDSWSYGDFGCVGAGCSTSFGGVKTADFTVKSVIGPTVTGTMRISFTNGTARSSQFTINVQNPAGNGFPLIIAGGLSAGNPIFPLPFFPAINTTFSKVYAERQRSVNMFEIGSSPGMSSPGATAFLWDQKTGILVEFLAAQPMVGTIRGAAAHAVLKSTNVWSPENEPHFSLSTGGFFLTAPRGKPVTAAIEATSSDFSKTISLTASLFPTGPGPTANIEATITAPKDSSATATLTLATANELMRYYIVSVTGVSGTRSDTTFLVINATIT